MILNGKKSGIDRDRYSDPERERNWTTDSTCKDNSVFCERSEHLVSTKG